MISGKIVLFNLLRRLGATTLVRVEAARNINTAAGAINAL